MIAATALALLLAAEPLREREVVEGEIAQLENLRPSPLLYAVGGGLAGAGVVASMAGLFASSSCSSSEFICFSHYQPWGPPVLAVGVTLALVSVVGLLTLLVVRTVYGLRIAGLEDELKTIKADANLTARPGSRTRETRELERRVPD